MKNISIVHYSLFILIALCATSCRPQGDDLLSYGQNDYQAYYAANSSFAGEFKAFWTAMNENYGIWDYEQTFGTDWDEVYRTYLPKFEELDEREDNPVTDKELQTLYEQITDTLHDGHMTLMIKNLHTGKYISVDPQMKRMRRERGQEMTDVGQNLTNLNTYRTSAAGAYQMKEYDHTSAFSIAIELIDSSLTRAVRAVDAYVAAVDSIGRNATNDSLYASALLLKNDAQDLLNTIRNTDYALLVMYKSVLLSGYKRIQQTYGTVGKMLGAPIAPIEQDLQDDLLRNLQYALFDGNIAYLRLGGFGLVYHLDPQYQTHDSTTVYFAYQQAVRRVWQRWFDAIQTLHKSGRLGGVIIDVRNNSGGAVSDYQWVLGAMLPSGGWESHTMRMKNGIGRLDFGPLMPFIVPTYEGTHEVVDDRPIVVLANCRSVSMAENTTWGVKSQPNGCFIGTRTYGALSALLPSPENYSDNYSGAFGVQDVTPIYGYVPKFICLYGQEMKPVEGYGFEPDIEVPLDVNLWQTTGRDNQLEKAVDYIRTR